MPIFFSCGGRTRTCDLLMYTSATLLPSELPHSTNHIADVGKMVFVVYICWQGFDETHTFFGALSRRRPVLLCHLDRQLNARHTSTRIVTLHIVLHCSKWCYISTSFSNGISPLRCWLMYCRTTRISSVYLFRHSRYIQWV